MSVPEGRFQKPQLFLHPDCEKHHIWWCSKMWFGPVKLLRKVTNPWAARLTRSRSVRCSAPTDHELMILLLSSASALARLPAFLRTPSRICSSLGLASVNTLPISAEDRKSTRLNSSHGYISYAVFCLKKKKPTNETRLR